MAGNLNVPAFANIVIAEVVRPADVRAVEELQKEVWGIPDLGVVPFTQLVAAKAAGGVLLGAFDDEALVGFVYGFVGFENGRTTHHSHMLAVKPAYRNLNIGYKLKLAQRDFVLVQGISEITWTFDPLQSLNAYFNFNRLGVVSDRYLIDFYGSDAVSFLHRNGTDRLWVTWPLVSRRTEERLESEDREFIFKNLEPLIEVGKKNEPVRHDRDPSSTASLLFIEIPADIHSLEQHDFELATAWRKTTRSAFSSAFAKGYIAADFIRGASTGKYILRRDRASNYVN